MFKLLIEPTLTPPSDSLPLWEGNIELFFSPRLLSAIMWETQLDICDEAFAMTVFPFEFLLPTLL
jgi:hypothetical protein